jgi:hypothetical protein
MNKSTLPFPTLQQPAVAWLRSKETKEGTWIRTNYRMQAISLQNSVGAFERGKATSQNDK